MTKSTDNWMRLIRAIIAFEADPARVRVDRLLAIDSEPDHARTYRLFLGILRNWSLYRYLIDKWANREPKPKLRALLLTGVEQLHASAQDTQRFPKIVHHTVGLVRQQCSSGESRFANALLRRVAENLDSCLGELDETGQWATRYSHPEWLIERWRLQFGDASTRELLRWNQRVPTLYVHDLTGMLAEANHPNLRTSLSLTPSAWTDYYAIGKPGPDRIGRLLDHPFYVQDPSTRLAIECFEGELRGSVLDACAAPGGKTLALRKRMGENDGEIVAVDRDSGRIALIEQNLQRLHTDRVSTRIHDWESKSAFSCPQPYFSHILLDAPCTSSGIIQKHPEIRWRLTPRDFVSLPKQQIQILSSVASCLKTGGQLVYSTCSMDRAENHEVIEAFLDSPEGRGIQLIHQHVHLPHENRHDGVGVALLKRPGDPGKG